jgi:MORN repeat
MTYKDGASYKGSWFNDLKHGFGTEFNNDGSVFNGDFYKGVK